MSLRRILNGNPAIVTAIVLAVIAAAGWIIFDSARGRAAYKATTRAFFSADDGKTWFADDINKIPPVKMADGREALRAVVISCDRGKDPFVSYLFRYTPEAKQILDKDAEDAAGETGREFKKPGESEWVKQRDYARAMKITTLSCPSGEKDLVIVTP